MEIWRGFPAFDDPAHPARRAVQRPDRVADPLRSFDKAPHPPGRRPRMDTPELGNPLCAIYAGRWSSEARLARREREIVHVLAEGPTTKEISPYFA